MLGLFNLFYIGKKKSPLMKGATYRNSLTTEIEKHLMPKYQYCVVYIRETGDVNYNMDVVISYDETKPVGRIKRDPNTGWLSYRGLFTGVSAEIRCFGSEVEDEHLFDNWLGRKIDDIPNPIEMLKKK